MGVDSVDIGQAITYLTVIALACFAGAVDFVNELREKWGQQTMKFILFSLFARLMSAGFAGLLMFWILQAGTDDGIVILSGWSAFSIAISGYLGDQAIKLFVSIWNNLYGGKK